MQPERSDAARRNFLRWLAAAPLAAGAAPMLQALAQQPQSGLIASASEAGEVLALLVRPVGEEAVAAVLLVGGEVDAGAAALGEPAWTTVDAAAERAEPARAEVAASAAVERIAVEIDAEAGALGERGARVGNAHATLAGEAGRTRDVADATVVAVGGEVDALPVAARTRRAGVATTLPRPARAGTSLSAAVADAVGAAVHAAAEALAAVLRIGLEVDAAVAALLLAVVALDDVDRRAAAPGEGRTGGEEKEAREERSVGVLPHPPRLTEEARKTSKPAGRSTGLAGCKRLGGPRRDAQRDGELDMAFPAGGVALSAEQDSSRRQARMGRS